VCINRGIIVSAASATGQFFVLRESDGVSAGLALPEPDVAAAPYAFRQGPMTALPGEPGVCIAGMRQSDGLYRVGEFGVTKLTSYSTRGPSVQELGTAQAAGERVPPTGVGLAAWADTIAVLVGGHRDTGYRRVELYTTSGAQLGSWDLPQPGFAIAADGRRLVLLWQDESGVPELALYSRQGS
jgi:hypothetical protein